MDFDNFTILNLSLTTSDPILRDLTDDLYDSWLSNAPKRTRKKTKHLTYRAIEAFVSSLFQAHWASDSIVALSLNSRRYREYSHHGIGYRPVKNAFDTITNDWELDGSTLPPLVQPYMGYWDRITDFKNNTKIQLNQDSLSSYLLKKYGINDITETYLLDTVFRERKSEKDEILTPITNRLKSSFSYQSQLPDISLRDEYGRRLSFDANPEIRAMSAFLGAYNRRLARTRVALFLEDEQFGQLLDCTAEKLKARGRRKDMTQTVSRLLGWEPTKLHRVFNQSSFERGGRFYGGWWQNIPRPYRSRITINGQATVELDFKSLHPTMIYHRKGLSAPSDPYDVGGPRTAEFRKIVKKAMMAMINAKPTARHLSSLRDLDYPIGWSPKRMIDAIEAAHPEILDAFRSGVGVVLQRKDSDIAEIVMREMWETYQQVVLPVHDSFIVDERFENQLKEAMIVAYESVMGSAQIEIKRKASIWELIGSCDQSAESEFLFRVAGCPHERLIAVLSARRGMTKKFSTYLRLSIEREIQLLDPKATGGSSENGNHSMTVGDSLFVLDDW